MSYLLAFLSSSHQLSIGAFTIQKISLLVFRKNYPIFLSILHRFSNCFIILLEGDAVVHAYVLDRMLAEFTAASVNMAKETVGEAGKEEGKISASTIVGSIEDIPILKHSTTLVACLAFINISYGRVPKFKSSQGQRTPFQSSITLAWMNRSTFPITKYIR